MYVTLQLKLKKVRKVDTRTSHSKRARHLFWPGDWLDFSDYIFHLVRQTNFDIIFYWFHNVFTYRVSTKMLQSRNTYLNFTDKKLSSGMLYKLPDVTQPVGSWDRAWNQINVLKNIFSFLRWENCKSVIKSRSKVAGGKKKVAGEKLFRSDFLSSANSTPSPFPQCYYIFSSNKWHLQFTLYSWFKTQLNLIHVNIWR